MPHRESTQDVQGGRPIIHYAVRGFPLNDATQGGIWGVSKILDLEWPGVGVSDGGMEPYNDGQMVKIKIESMQNTYVAIKRAIYLARAIQTVVVNFDLDYYNFINPYDLGMEFTFEADGSSCILTITYSGRVLKSQWNDILAAATGATTGGTGGTAVSALTSQQFDDTEYGGSGIIGIYVGTGDLSTDDELGLKEQGGSKFSMQVVKNADTTTYLKPITQRIEFKNTVALLENRYTTLARNAAYTNTEKVITWVFGCGATIVLENCTKLLPGPKINDSLGLVEIKNEGSTYLDPVNATPANVTFDDETKTITFHKQGAIL